MGWFLITVFFVIVAVVCLVAGRLYGKEPNADRSVVLAWRGGAAVAIVLWLLISVFMSFEQVDAGHVGVVKTFGRITGQITPGVSMIAPWQSVDNVNVQVQKKTFDNLAAFSAETQNVNITTTINYSVAPDQVQDLIRRVGTDWFDRLVPNNLNQSFKDETVKFPAVEIAPNREAIRTAVLADMRKRLSPYSIRINDINVDNIAFSQQFEAAIEAKQEATQAALRAQAQVKQAEFEAQSKVAQAKGEANANVAIAEGQAEANRKLNESLSANVLQYIAIQKLADNVTIALLPSGSGSLIDPTKLLQGAGGK